VQEKERIAHHEAAHAVASIRFERKFDSVTICSDSEYKGCLRGLEELTDRRKEVIVRLAGFAADIKLSPESEIAARKGVENDDFREARFYLQLIDDLDPEESNLEYWIAKAGKLVEEDWTLIDGIAWTLLNKGTLTSKEVESIVQISDAREQKRRAWKEKLKEAGRRIGEHPGYKEILELDALNRSLSGIFVPNFKELLSLLEEASTNPLLAGELIQNVRKPTVRDRFQLDLTRSLHNYLASSHSLVDHVRRLMRHREGPIAEEFLRRKQELLQNPEVPFMADLRNFIVHRTIPFFAHRFGSKSGQMDSEVELETVELLEWDGWSAPAKAYLKAQGHAVAIRPVIKKHGQLILELNAWLHKELCMANAEALKEVNKLIAIRNAVLAEP
jgi:hypothetical protein